MMQPAFTSISGKQDDVRLESRLLEERIQAAVASGARQLQIQAFGQHGIGGRLWRSDDEPIRIEIKGHPGQRVGSMGFPNTQIEVYGPASDDVGWLNAGADITIHGNAGNGVANAMAQGRISVAGNIGARGMTMTKHNPRFQPPELWIMGSVGDYFGEFMAGGIAVVCGHGAQNPENILGYRPLVGMVGGRVFFRGPHQGFSHADAKALPISDDDYEWLCDNLRQFLQRVRRTQLYEQLAQRNQWQLLTARSPMEKKGRGLRSMTDFRQSVWEVELGRGGLVGDLTDTERGPIAPVPTGDLRRFVPVWENRLYAAPCEATCPTGIPVQERWRLIREGRMAEAVDLALAYTPFPATVCGYLCPNPCMSACTRQMNLISPVDVTQLGKASADADKPVLPPLSGARIAVIGGGPAGISVAWQLRQKGHEAVVYDTSSELGGKVTSVIPNSRIPVDVVASELTRVRDILPHIHLQQPVGREELDQMHADFDYLIIAIGAQRPRTLPIPGNERLIPALTFLEKAKRGQTLPGERVVVIGAGNVGCDVATEAHRLGARDITLIDIQEPASFGKERQDAEKAGAKFIWPVAAKQISAAGVELDDGRTLPADSVYVSIGDAPDLDFLPSRIARERGFVAVNEFGQTSDDTIFAIGDVVKPGLLTDAIGAGRLTAEAIDDMIRGRRPQKRPREMIDRERISLEYFDPRVIEYNDMDHCGSQCASCGTCRDCELCVAVCPQAAISRHEDINGEAEYIVTAERCIACGFCAAACPCGVWNLVENEPLP